MIKTLFRKTDLWIVLGFMIVYVTIFDAKLDFGGDNAGYYILGKSIITGQGYTDLHLPGANAANHFPPGYPVILSLMMTISDNFIFLKIINGLLFLFSLLILQRIFERMTQQKSIAWIALLFTLLNSHLLRSSTIIMSEIPFLFFSLAALSCLIKYTDEEFPFWRSKWFWSLIVLCAISYHIRTAGLALIAGVIFYLASRKKWKVVVSFASGVVLLSLPWFLRGKRLGGNSYLTQLIQNNPYRPEDGVLTISGWGDRILDNLFRYVNQEIPNGLFPNFEVFYSTEEPKGYLLYGLIILFFIIIGSIKMPKLKMMWLGYLLASAFIFLLWPSVWFGVRFMQPLIPFLLLSLVIGLSVSLKWIQIKYFGAFTPKSIYILVIIGLLPLSSLKTLRIESQYPVELEYANYFNIGRYAGNSIPESSIVCTVKPSLFYLHSSRTSSRIPSLIDKNDFILRLEELGITHVVVDQLGYSSVGRYLLPAIQEFPERFNLILQLPNPDTYLLEFIPRD
ncbi:MAG: Uncharacterised protein [Owenweeksia sp. TMED14]|nr:MAG: Uncharacterised protein [Owenweeksia sp. TMED14]